MAGVDQQFDVLQLVADAIGAKAWRPSSAGAVAASEIEGQGRSGSRNGRKGGRPRKRARASA